MAHHPPRRPAGQRRSAGGKPRDDREPLGQNHGHQRGGRGAKRRALSQNLLVDPGAARAVVRAADPSPTGLVIEVGAGSGALTGTLARRSGRLLAYEIDPVFAGQLRQHFADYPSVSCVTGDFLRARPPREPFAVVGNIPYALTARIVEWCLAAPTLTSATLVTQLEYARKRTGDFGRWSQLTVTHWPTFEWRLLGRIGRESFRPVPRVDSGILRLQRRAHGLLPPPALPAYRRFVALGFTGVGGSLYATLRREHPTAALQAAFAAAGLARGTIVAYVSPHQWITVFRLLHGFTERDRPGRGGRR